MRALIYACNALVLVASALATAILTLFMLFGAFASLRRLQLDDLVISLLMLGAVALLARLLQFLWRKNQESAKGAPGSAYAAAVAPLLAGLLAAGAYGLMYLFQGLTRSGTAKATVASLGALRSALSIYYGDMEGLYPEDLGSLLVQKKYLAEIPVARTLVHPETRDFTFFGSVSSLDTGTWGYVNNPYDGNYGSLFIDCTHTDPRMSVWTGY